MTRLILITVITAALSACGGGAGATAGSGATTGPGATPAAGGNATPGTGGATSTTGAQTPEYQAGAGTATVVVDGTSHPITGGTCALESGDAGGVSASKFSFVAGTAMKAGWLDIELSALDAAIHDGEYKTGLSTVTAQVDDSDYLLLSDLTITLQNGITSGTFSGTSAGNNPVSVTGTFTC